MRTFIPLLIFSVFTKAPQVSAQSVLFDFDNAPIHSNLPVSLSAGGITAHFSATGQGYSIQDNSAPVVPRGFTGRFIYPNSIFLADLLISFDTKISDFSIMYSCQELGCDDAATMRVTAFLKGSFTGTSTKTAGNPGTWPVDTLKCSFLQGFDSVVVHYDHRPPTCQDYGVIFLADNMRVTPSAVTVISDQKIFNNELIIPNPVSQSATISLSLFKSENIIVNVYDITGKLVKNLFNCPLKTGEYRLYWDVKDDGIKEGLYVLKVTGNSISRTSKFRVIK